jgi:hypothetical protein
MPLQERTLDGVTVLDTPLITKALQYARKHLNDVAYNHSVRSWLYGVVIAANIPSLKTHDRELHAISAILHDLGWAPTGDELVSKDKRFEVDGAEAARAFLIKEANKNEWDKHRLQLVWDSIALHSTSSIADYKEIEVQITNKGIMADFLGPEKPFNMLTRTIWDGIAKEFPRDGLKEGVIEACCEICRTKPETTYDNFVSDFGIKFVPEFSREGYRVLDVVENMKE